MKRVPDADAIDQFARRPGVWLTFAGSAFLKLYAEKLKPLGLKPSWVTALAIVSERPGITQSALGRALVINRASSMALATMLEKAGLLSRSATVGRPQTCLSLTDLGILRLKEACDLEDRLVVITMSDLTPDQIDVFVDTLRRIISTTNQVKMDC